MPDLSTRQHAEKIAESVMNGQRKQAAAQFNEALQEHCAARALLEEIAELVGNEEALFLAARIIDLGE